MKAVAQTRSGFKFWFFEKQGFLRAFLLIVSYLSLALFLIALIAFGGPTSISNALLGIFLSSILSVYFLFQFRYRPRLDGRLSWHWISPRGSIRTKLASILWALVVVVLIGAAVYARAHIHK